MPPAGACVPNPRGCRFFRIPRLRIVQTRGGGLGFGEWKSRRHRLPSTWGPRSTARRSRSGSWSRRILAAPCADLPTVPVPTSASTKRPIRAGPARVRGGSPSRHRVRTRRRGAARMLRGIAPLLDDLGPRTRLPGSPGTDACATGPPTPGPVRSSGPGSSGETLFQGTSGPRWSASGSPCCCAFLPPPPRLCRNRSRAGLPCAAASDSNSCAAEASWKPWCPGFDKKRALVRLSAHLGCDFRIFGGDDGHDLPLLAELRGRSDGLAVFVRSPDRPSPGILVDDMVDGPEGWASWLDDLADLLESRPA
jgi:hypothetical protein